MSTNLPEHIYKLSITQGSTKTEPISPEKIEFKKSQQQLVIPIAADFNFITETPSTTTVDLKKQVVYIWTLSLNFNGEIKSSKKMTMANFNLNKQTIEFDFKTAVSQYFSNLSLSGSFDPSGQVVIGSQFTGYYSSTHIRVDSINKCTAEFDNVPIPEKYTKFNNYEISGSLNMELSVTINPLIPPPKTYIGSYTLPQSVQWYLQFVGLVPMAAPALLSNDILNNLLFQHQKPYLNNQNLRFSSNSAATGILRTATMVLICALAPLGV